MASDILTLNAGSSSLKFSLWQAGTGMELRELFRGEIEKIGIAPHLSAREPGGRTVIDNRFDGGGAKLSHEDQAGNEAATNRVIRRREDNRDDRCRLLCRDNCCGSIRHDDIHLEPDELGGDFGKALRTPLSPVNLKHDCAPLNPTEFAHSLEKSGNPLPLTGRGAGAEQPDFRQARRGGIGRCGRAILL
jgi:hypothetical protein